LKDLKLHTPNGLNDLLPAGYIRKRGVERQIEAVFERYGYAFVSSPTLEYLAVFEGKGSIPSTEMYKFMDRNGDILALRPDMTPAVARIVATNSMEDPIRLCYIEKAFRHHKHFQGRENEFTQAGAELICQVCQTSKLAVADAETIAVAVHGLLAAGLTNFRVDIGQVDFLPGVLAELPMDDNERQAFMDYMISRDYVAAENHVKQINKNAGMTKQVEKAVQLLSDLTQLTGGTDILAHAHSLVSETKAQAALRHLEDVYAILRDQGLEKYILLDLGMTGQLDYYTGIIFKGYAKGTGTTIVDGGRYDRLIGSATSAVGFGIKIEGLLDALSAQGIISECKLTDTFLAYHENARAIALQTADVMRQQGVYIENSLQSGSLEEHKAYAVRKKHKGILYFDMSNKVILVNLETNQEQEVEVSDLLGGGDNVNHSIGQRPIS